MKIQKTVWQETGRIALGLLICDAIEIGVFALLSQLDLSVLLGVLIGTFFSLLNFFLLCVSVQKAMDKTEGQSKYLQRIYLLRMIMIIAVLTAAYVIESVHLIATCVPFVADKAVIYIVKLMENKKATRESAGDDPK